MKKLLLIVASLLCLVACKTTYQTTLVNYLSGDANTLSLRCVGQGEKTIEIAENAQKNAIQTILFRGMPASQQTMPLVTISEAEALKTHKEYFDELFENGRYKTFITTSIPVGNATKYKGMIKQQTFDITVNLRALRIDLEQNNIIRKFGF